MVPCWRLAVDNPLLVHYWLFVSGIYCDSFIGPIQACLQRAAMGINILVRWLNPDVFTANGSPSIHLHRSNCENVALDLYLGSCIGPMIKNRWLNDAKLPLTDHWQNSTGNPIWLYYTIGPVTATGHSFFNRIAMSALCWSAVGFPLSAGR